MTHKPNERFQALLLMLLSAAALAVFLWMMQAFAPTCSDPMSGPDFDAFHSGPLDILIFKQTAFYYLSIGFSTSRPVLAAGWLWLAALLVTCFYVKPGKPLLNPSLYYGLMLPHILFVIVGSAGYLFTACGDGPRGAILAYILLTTTYSSFALSVALDLCIVSFCAGIVWWRTLCAPKLNPLSVFLLAVGCITLVLHMAMVVALLIY